MSREPNTPKSEKIVAVLLIILALLATWLTMSGCSSVGETARAVSDDLGDKALNANALVHIVKITPSDPATNSMPTGKAVTVIGSIESVPLVGKPGETVKDYFKYGYTETPSFWNSSSVTREETLIVTGSHIKLVKEFLQQKQER